MAEVKVLIVEDEVLTAELIKLNLKKDGFSVLEPVATGEEAVEISALEKPDIILMDINLLGKMDGIEAANKIISIFETHIIFITGYDDEEFRTRAIELKPAEYFIKPIDFNKLKNCMWELAKSK